MPLAVMGGILGGIGTMSSSIAESRATRQQGRFERQQADFNADMMDLQAQDAVRRGDASASKLKQEARKLQGSQRASFAAQGVDLGSDTAIQLQTDTEVQSELDAQEIKNNAWREAFGFKQQSRMSRQQGKVAEMTAGHIAKNTILTGGMKALTQVAGGAMDSYRYQQKGKESGKGP